ncbi:MAG: hypothetical protein ACK40G_16670 [Cytophagaceae bacterium]
MKSRILGFVFFLVFVVFAQLVNAQTVYVTENGKKYHKKNCSIVKEGKKGTELKEAKANGYEPCKVCYGETKKQEATEPKKK